MNDYVDVILMQLANDNYNDWRLEDNETNNRYFDICSDNYEN